MSPQPLEGHFQGGWLGVAQWNPRHISNAIMSFPKSISTKLLSKPRNRLSVKLGLPTPEKCQVWGLSLTPYNSSTFGSLLREVRASLVDKMFADAWAFLKKGTSLSGSHRSTHIASDLASRVLASQAKPQRESESQAFRIARS